MEQIVEYINMRPRYMVERRDAMPVAYIGTGVLEWHGLHNPLGLDGIKTHLIACMLAKELGGIVMPPQFWGDYRLRFADVEFTPDFNQSFSQPENVFDHTIHISELMGVDQKTYLKDTEHGKKYGEWDLWEKLMVRTMFQTETIGFKAIILLPGHFPSIAPLDRAIERYRQEGGLCKVLSFNEFDLANPELAGDHAAAFETSLMLALCPDLADLNELDSDLTKPSIGVHGLDPRVHASKEYGEKILASYLAHISAYLKEIGLM